MSGRGPFDWSRVGEDALDEAIAKMVGIVFDAGVRLILVSGRDEVCREETEEWLEESEINYHFLYMRPEGNNEDDRIIKRRIYEEKIKDKFNILFVLDDRPKVIRMWKELGLKVLDCGNGVEF